MRTVRHPLYRLVLVSTVLAVVCGFAHLAQLHAASPVILPPNMATNDHAFGAGVLSASLRIQEVYGAVNFPTGALVMTELRYRPDYAYGFAFTTSVANLEIRLSTCTNAPDHLSTKFSQNVGGDETVVFSGPLNLASRFTGPANGPKDFDIVIPLTTPFVYAPAWGHLLVDIRNYSGSKASPLAGQGLSTDSASRLFSGSVGATTGSADTGVDALEIIYTPTNAPPPPPPPPPQLLRGPYLNNRGPTNIVVRWRTDVTTDSRVFYGPDPSNLSFFADNTLAAADHIVALTGLQPETRYYYSVGTLAAPVYSNASFTFVTAPPSGASRPTRIWFVSDEGYGDYPWQAEVRDAYSSYVAATGKPTDVWLTGGDNTQYYAADEWYDLFFSGYPTVLRNTPIFTTLGNHDVDQYYTLPFSVVADDPYFHNYSEPTNGEVGGVASGNQSYYSFDYADIHFISLNGLSHDLRQPNSEMFQWLARDLAATTQRWKIAFWHTPPYTKGSHDSDSLTDTDGTMVDMRENFVPILETYGVDLVLNGHSHVYERTYLLNGHYGFSSTFDPTNKVDGGNGREDGTGAYLKPANRGAVYVTAGVGSYPFSGPLNHPAHVVKFQGYAGSCLMDVNSNRLDYRFIAADGTVMDYFTLLKGASQSAPPAIPANFQATSYGSSAVLTWHNNATNEMSYGLECSVNGAPFGEIALVGANLTTFTNAGLDLLANTYQYRIRAWNNAGYSDYSPTAGVTPPPPPPILLVRGPYLQAATTTNIVVRWRTDSPADSRVQFGLASDALSWKVSDPALTTEHIVTLTNLSPGTQYFYAIGSSTTNLASGTNCCFATSPTNAKPTRIWAIGDSGTASQPGYEGMAAQVRDAYLTYTGARPTDVWLMLGDNAYLSGTDAQFQTELFDVYPALLQRCSLWPTIGNHDVTVGGGDYAELNVFSTPLQGEAGGVPSGSKHYYSFNFGNIHFVCLDCEDSDRSPGSPMLTWLEADLAANTNDWLIAFFHRPPYVFGTHNSDLEEQMTSMRENAVPILEAHGVDLVLSGHSHDYERSYLLDGHYGYSYDLLPTMIKDSGSGRPEESGAYLKAGLGPNPHQGAVYAVVGSSGWVTADGGWGQYPAMFVKERQLGSMVIDVNSNRLDAKFLRNTGSIDDQFTIIKGAPPEPFRFATFLVSGNVVRAQWKSVAGQTYHVQKSGGLETPNWITASPDITATGATTGWTNSILPAANHSFYRVVRLQGVPGR